MSGAKRPRAQWREGIALRADARVRKEDGAPGGIRTPDQWLRKPLSKVYSEEFKKEMRCVNIH